MIAIDAAQGLPGVCWRVPEELLLAEGRAGCFLLLAHCMCRIAHANSAAGPKGERHGWRELKKSNQRKVRSTKPQLANGERNGYFRFGILPHAETKHIHVCRPLGFP